MSGLDDTVGIVQRWQTMKTQNGDHQNLKWKLLNGMSLGPDSNGYPCICDHVAFGDTADILQRWLVAGIQNGDHYLVAILNFGCRPTLSEVNRVTATSGMAKISE